MTKTPISLQDLRRTIYVKAKAEPTWRFWGLYVHVCKMETLHESYRVAKQNKGGAGSRRCHVCGHRGRRSGEFSESDSGRTSLVYVSTLAGTEAGDTERRGHKSPRPFDSLHPRPCSPGSAQAHPGADIRS